MNLDGDCHFLLAVHVGQEIDLERAEARLSSPSTRARLRHKRALASGGGQRSCLRMELGAERVEVAGLRTAPDVGVSLYDLGAVCVCWRFPFSSSIEGLIALSEALYEHTDLTHRARAIVRELLEVLDEAVRRPRLTEEVEDYAIFQVLPGEPAATLADAGRRRLAGLLRGESQELSEQEVEDAVSHPIAYAPREACYLDWLAAVLIGEHVEDERLVLEVATVALLELRVLDEELRAGVEEAYGALARARTGLRALAARSAQLERIARMQADGALLHEGVANPLKLLGDDYLARLHERAAQRFHLAEWDLSIERKLKVLESVYQKLSDLAAQRRGEALEWIIILLIAVDIVLFLGGAR